ncbi:MAG: sodium:proton antiporter [Phycisphaerae bacterium]|nr:sodium:proton antiporter [Phycisphaerae bacterium]
MPEEQAILLELVVIVVLGGGAQWLAWQLRLPSILLLLLFGFLAGPVARELLPGTSFGLDPNPLFGGLLLPLVSLSVAVILFEGGLTLNFRELRATGHVVRNLVTVGALTTWLICSAAACLLLGLDLRVSILIGAVLIVTGPTVIMPLLRHVRPTGAVGPVLKWEGIVIDPLGALVTVLAFEVLFAHPHLQAPLHVLVAVLKTVVVGGGLGLAAAGLLTLAVARYWVPEFLHNVVAMFLVCGVFVLSNRVQAEGGLLSVTVMGIALANQRYADMKHIREFKENLRVFLISALFILLAARLRLDDLRGLGPGSLLFVAVLIFVARPLGVAVATLRSKLTWRERLFLAWMAPRGIVAAAVASVFAIQLEHAAEAAEAAGLSERAELLADHAGVLIPLTFITIVGTVLVYGITAALVAQRLGLAEAKPQGVLIVGAHRLAREIGRVLQEHKFRVLLVDTNRGETAAAKMAALPTFHGSIVGEETLEELDLGGLGRLLALTPNDEVNVLAVQRFAPIFGRASVYQLPPRAGAAGRVAMDKHLAGRWLFGTAATSEHLRRQLDAGAVIKATRLTESFDYRSFGMMYGPDAVPLFTITEAGGLNIRTAEESSEPKPGQTLISLVFDKPATVAISLPRRAGPEALP